MDEREGWGPCLMRWFSWKSASELGSQDMTCWAQGGALPPIGWCPGPGANTGLCPMRRASILGACVLLAAMPHRARPTLQLALAGAGAPAMVQLVNVIEHAVPHEVGRASSCA